MTKNLFSVPIFFIVFRETLEASIIISVLLGLVEQIARPATESRLSAPTETSTLYKDDKQGSQTEDPSDPHVKKQPETASEHLAPSESGDPSSEDEVLRRRFLRKMRIQIFLGSGIGLFIALAIGAAFIAVWFTQASDLWSKSEDLWEGIFSLVASIIIFVMGVTMLKMDRAQLKWRVKLQKAFEGKHVDGRTKTGKWVLLLLPLITVLREGMEAVIFVGGVSLGQPATAIPIAAIVGIVCGLVVGYIIYTFASRAALKVFMVVMTNFILLIGSGLFSKAIWSIQTYRFNKLLGAQVDDTGGDGPGSYDVRGNVWHLDCCNPENNLDGNGWLLFGAIFGWTNNATLGSVLGYVFYWIAVMVSLIYAKWSEGRMSFFGYESPATRKRRVARQLESPAQ